MQRLITHLESKIGMIRIAGTENGIDEVRFVDVREGDTPGISEGIRECVLQLEQYFLGKQKEFHSLRLNMHGTDFNQRVWDAVQEVPFGETITYKELAKAVGKESSVRAVGNALNANPLQIIIPCHRVICSTGDIGEYAAGRDVKEWLLEHEKRKKQSLND